MLLTLEEYRQHTEDSLLLARIMAAASEIEAEKKVQPLYTRGSFWAGMGAAGAVAAAVAGGMILHSNAK